MLEKTLNWKLRSQVNILHNIYMEVQPLSNIDDYNLFVQHCANNFYHLNIVDPDNVVHHFEGIYSSPQAAVEKGKSVIENFKFWRRKTLK